MKKKNFRKNRSICYSNEFRHNGCSLSGFKNVSRLLNTALDHGVNYIDTSPEYPMAEYFIGKAIANRRDEYILATKCGDNMTGVGETYIFDRKTIISNMDESLRLMKTDHVDILQLHGVIPELLGGGAFGEAMEAMRELKKPVKHFIWDLLFVTVMINNMVILLHLDIIPCPVLQNGMISKWLKWFMAH